MDRPLRGSKEGLERAEKGKILVVEGERVVGAHIESVLRHYGYEVVGNTGHSKEGVALALERQPDLVLMDMDLQNGEDGIEATERLLEKRFFPIVYITSYDDDEAFRRAQKTSPFGYLMKPFYERELERTVEVALQRVRWEEGLRERVRRQGAYAQALALPMVAVDASGRIEYLNKSAQNLLFREEEQVLGLRLAERVPLFSLQGEPFQEHPLKRVLLKGVEETGEYIIRREGKGPVPLRVLFSPLLEGVGEVTGAVIVLKPLEPLAGLLGRGDGSQEIGKLRTFVDEHVHDFNNILTTLLGNISLVKKSGSGISEKSMERLDQAEIAVMRAQEIVRKLRELPRPNLSKRRIYTIEKLLRETVLFALNGSPVRPVFEIEPDLPPVEIDEGEITQVFQNLTINALQAMPEGGNFFVSARRVSFNADGGGGKPHLQIGFTDQGRGIPQENLARIFDPYFTTKLGGSGLGLSSSRAIVRSHGGWIDVASRWGEGTTLTILLPAVGGMNSTVG